MDRWGEWEWEGASVGWPCVHSLPSSIRQVVRRDNSHSLSNGHQQRSERRGTTAWRGGGACAGAFRKAGAGAGLGVQGSPRLGFPQA